MCPSSSHRFSPFPKMAVASPDAVDDLAGNTATCEKAIDEESNGGMAAECPNASGYSAEISTVREECEDKEVEPDKTCEQEGRRSPTTSRRMSAPTSSGTRLRSAQRATSARIMSWRRAGQMG